MYKKNKMQKTSLQVNQGIEGETIEQKIERVVNNNEPIEDGAPIIYTERKDGVIEAYNPRTDRFEVAVEAMDAVARAETAKRESRINERSKAKMEKVKGGKSDESNEGGQAEAESGQK